MPTQPTLTDAEREQFLTRGHVVVKKALSPQVCRQAEDAVFERMGYDRNDKSTWEAGKVHMPTTQHWTMEDLSPRAWQVACELVGGEDRVKKPYRLSDAYIVNFHFEDDKGWQPPKDYIDQGGWHKDGDFFRHFLDSPEQGLLTLVCYTDLVHQGGSTFIACDSVPMVARHLNEHREGVLPGGFDFKGMVRQCHDLLEVQAEAGDIIFLHPYMLHSASPNVKWALRIITNPPIQLNEPMQFDRTDPAELSLVEQAVLRGLGVDRLDFKPQAPRESIVPERVKRQQKLREEELARAAAAAK